MEQALLQEKKTSPKPIRVLVVDDHPLVRQGLTQFINQEKDIQVYADASDGHEALEIIENDPPDLVITDLEMRGLTGMDLLQHIKTHHPDIPVLMLSMHAENLYAQRALHAGASGYLMKEEDPEVVVNAIRAIHAGDVYYSPKAIKQFLSGYNKKGSNSQGRIVDRLSKREFEVFKMIGDGYRTRHIAEKLFLSPKTVESYKGRLKEKLTIKDAAELARFASEWVKTSSRM